MIEAKQLQKSFSDRKRGSVLAVDAVSFCCHPGQIYGLLGANGAGKTTTLRMLATLLSPCQGTASVAGFDIRTDPAQVRRRIGFLSGSTALYGRLTAKEMIEYFGRLNGMEGIRLQQRIGELVEILHLEEFLHGRCDKLSTGQKQRVSIARSIVHDPEVMIFDEPTTGLDIMTAKTIIDFIRECKNRGKTVIFSTHILSEVEKLCDMIGIIHAGRLQAEGSLPELRRKTGCMALEDVFLAVVENGNTSPAETRTGTPS